MHEQIVPSPRTRLRDVKFTAPTLSYLVVVIAAVIISLIVYQIGGLILGEVGFGIGTIAAVLCLAGLIYLLFRKGYQGERSRLRAVDAVKARV